MTWGAPGIHVNSPTTNLPSKWQFIQGRNLEGTIPHQERNCFTTRLPWWIWFFQLRYVFFSTIPRDPSSFFHLKRQWSAIIDEPRLRIFAFLACAQKTPPEVGNRTWVQAVSICETGMGSIKVNSYWNLMESMVPIHHCHQMWTTARVVTYESAGMMNIVGNQKRSTSNTMWFANRAWGFQAGGFSHK